MPLKAVGVIDIPDFLMPRRSTELLRGPLQYNDERLFLICPAVDHERSCRRLGAVVSHEMRRFGGNERGWA